MAYEKTYEGLKEITAVSALSGHEDRMIRYLVDKLKNYTDDIVVDYSGNITAGFKGTKNPEQKLLMFSHMDEVGMLVRKISDDGYLFFERLGGPSEKTLRSQIVDVYSYDEKTCYKGVVGTKSHHYTGDSEKLSVPNKHELYIDVGASSKQEVLDMGIDIGSTVTYTTPCTRIGKSRAVSKTMDNRAACYTLLGVAEYLSQHKPLVSVYIGFSVQEEFNIRGSLPMWERLKPEMCISLDCAVACDTPDLKMLYEIRLGDGPVISEMNTYGKGPAGGLISNPKFRTFIQKVADEKGMKYQREISAGVLSDGSFMQMKGEMGTVICHLGFPMRYSHSPSEVVDMKDIEELKELLIGTAMKVEGVEEFKRG